MRTGSIWKMIKRGHGFTLIELIIVVSILGVLVGIAVPMFNNQRENAQARSLNANVEILQGAVDTYQVERRYRRTNAPPTYLTGNMEQTLFNAGLLRDNRIRRVRNETYTLQGNWRIGTANF